MFLTNDLGFAILLIAALALAIAVYVLATTAGVYRRRSHRWKARALTAERRLSLRDDRDQREAAHFNSTPAAEHPAVVIPTTANGHGHHSWREAS